MSFSSLTVRCDFYRAGYVCLWQLWLLWPSEAWRWSFAVTWGAARVNAHLPPLRVYARYAIVTLTSTVNQGTHSLDGLLATAQ